MRFFFQPHKLELTVFVFLCLILLNIMSCFIHVASNNKISSFLWLNNRYYTFFLHSSGDGHVGWFHNLAPAICAAVNMQSRRLFDVLISFPVLYGITRSCGSSISRFLKNFHSLLHKVHTNLHFPPTVYESSLFSTSSPAVTTFIFLIIAGVRWYLMMV